MPRRDARRAKLSELLDAYFSDPANREDPAWPPHFANPPAPAPAEAAQEEEGQSSAPSFAFWRQRYLIYYRALTREESNPSHSMVHPAEDPKSPPPENRHVIVSADKDGEQYASDTSKYEDQTVHKFEEMDVGDDETIQKFEEMDVGEDVEEVDGGKEDQGTQHFLVPPKRRRQKALNPSGYAVQCAACDKWRFIPTKNKYEELRAHGRADPFECQKACEWKPNVTCDDPTDVTEEESGWLWAMDQHNIPQPHPGFERLIAIRGEGCRRFGDVYYRTPTGRKLRSSLEVERYLEENKEYATQGVNIFHFSFTIPASQRQDYVRKGAKVNANEGSSSSKPPLDEVEAKRPDVLLALPKYQRLALPMQAMAWSAPPTAREEPGASNRMVLDNEGGGPGGNTQLLQNEGEGELGSSNNQLN